MNWQGWVGGGVVVVAGLLIAGCGAVREADVSAETGQPTSELEQPYLGAVRGPVGPTGIVLETSNSGGYTYARIDAENGEIWVAAPAVEIAVGDTVLLAGARNMGPFESPTNDRTFEAIYFIDRFRFTRDGVDQIRPTTEAANSFRGDVTETMNAGGYTYLQVDLGEDSRWMAESGSAESLIWLAGPRAVLNVGDEVSWQGGSIMRNFRSSTLDRTFAEIVFVGSVTLVD